jgi:glutaredoxin
LRLHGVSTVTITLYSRPGCHLCDEMRAVAEPVAREVGARFEEMDVDADPVAAAEYDLEIPVLCVNGEKAFSIRTTAAALRARLAREPR